MLNTPLINLLLNLKGCLNSHLKAFKHPFLFSLAIQAQLNFFRFGNLANFAITTSQSTKSPKNKNQNFSTFVLPLNCGRSRE